MKIKIIFLLLPFFIFAQKKEKTLVKKITKDIAVNYVLQFPDDYKKSKHNGTSEFKKGGIFFL